MTLFGFDPCERARVLASLAPDDELSELDRRRLRAHLRGCAPCARFAHQVQHVSMLLREDEPVRPSLPALVPRTVRRRRVVTARVRPVAAAAAVALMALGIASRAPLDMDSSDAVRTAAPANDFAQREQDSLRAWRHEVLLQVYEEPLERSALLGRNQPL